MRVLLFGMPDATDICNFFFKLPNLAIASLAGNLQGHEVRTLDLVLYQSRVRAPIEKAVKTFKPDIIGFSGMTFQFNSLLRIARFIRKMDPSILIAVGGYHATVMAQEISANGKDIPLDFMVRGEGEETFRELVNMLEKPAPDFSHIKGLSYRHLGAWTHNPRRELQDLKDVRLPNRNARLAEGFYTLGLRSEVTETSRGCPYVCKFCSIKNMYGNTFRRYSIERIIADITAIKQRNAEFVFFADDNITYDPEHFKEVCRAIVKHGLNDIRYAIQASAVGLANHPNLVAEMEQANFCYVFVGFESMDPMVLKGLKKPANPEINRTAADLLRKHNMAVIAGCIFGYPNDTEKTIRENFRLIQDLLPDLIYSQYITPYPKTKIRDEMMAAGLVVNVDDFEYYDGFTCNIRTHHLSPKKLYRCLKMENIKSNFNIKAIAFNYFIKNHTWSFLKGIVLATFVYIYNVVKSKKKMGRLDV